MWGIDFVAFMTWYQTSVVTTYLPVVRRGGCLKCPKRCRTCGLPGDLTISLHFVDYSLAHSNNNKCILFWTYHMQNCLNFNIYFIKFFKILPVNGRKSHFVSGTLIFLALFHADFYKRGKCSSD